MPARLRALRSDGMCSRQEYVWSSLHPAILRLRTLSTDAFSARPFQVEETLGPIDVLVNNAGVAIQQLALKQSKEDWDKVRENS